MTFPHTGPGPRSVLRTAVGRADSGGPLGWDGGPQARIGNLLYKGTSPGLWLLEALVVVFTLAAIVWLVLHILLVLALLAGAALVALLGWWGWVELSDRLPARRRPAG